MFSDGAEVKTAVLFLGQIATLHMYICFIQLRNIKGAQKLQRMLIKLKGKWRYGGDIKTVKNRWLFFILLAVFSCASNSLCKPLLLDPCHLKNLGGWAR